MAEVGERARLRVEHDPGGVAWLILNRPECRNALDFELLADLTSALVTEGGRASVIVLRGAGPHAFSSGFDLRRLTGTASDLDADRAIGAAADAIRACPVPVIAAVHGHCQGAAVELALTCDLRLAAPDLLLGVPAVRLGVVYRPRLVARLAELGGLGLASDLLLAGTVLNAAAARAAGLLTEVVPEGRLVERAAALAMSLAAAPAPAVRGTKAVLSRLSADGLTDRDRAELEAWRFHAASSHARRDAFAAAQQRLAGKRASAEDAS